MTTARDQPKPSRRSSRSASLFPGASSRPSSGTWSTPPPSLGLSVSTIHKLAAHGELPCSLPSGRLFFDPDKVEAWAKGEAE